MALTNYSELKAVIAQWMKRNDRTNQIPDYITLAEMRIKTLVRLRVMETESTLSATASSDLIAIPSDFKSPVALWLNDINPREKLEQLLPQSMPYNTTPSRPMYWCIDGTNLRFQSPADQAYSVKLRYQQLFNLSNTTTTNYLLQDYPDVYLFGSLVEGFNDILQPQNAQIWEARFQEAMRNCNSQESSNQEDVKLRTEFGSISSRRFNINRGY
jgi:hypothetical protein